MEMHVVDLKEDVANRNELNKVSSRLFGTHFSKKILYSKTLTVGKNTNAQVHLIYDNSRQRPLPFS